MRIVLVANAASGTIREQLAAAGLDLAAEPDEGLPLPGGHACVGARSSTTTTRRASERFWSGARSMAAG